MNFYIVLRDPETREFCHTYADGFESPEAALEWFREEEPTATLHSNHGVFFMTFGDNLTACIFEG